MYNSIEFVPGPIEIQSDLVYDVLYTALNLPTLKRSEINSPTLELALYPILLQNPYEIITLTQF